MELTKAAADVLAERRRQIEVEGWMPEHDDKHVDGSLATAAACYVSPSHYRDPLTNIPVDWPWAAQWWKPKDRRRNLVRAAALIIAEIERFDRGVRRMIEQRED